MSKTYIPNKPSDLHTILARHKYRVRKLDGKIVPALKWFSIKQWNATSAGLDDDGKPMPKQGWVKVDPEKFFIPPEAQGFDDSNERGGSEVEEMSVDEQIEIRDTILDGYGDDFTVAKLRDFVRDNADVSITEVSKLNKAQLIQEIKNQLINVA